MFGPKNSIRKDYENFVSENGIDGLYAVDDVV